MKAVVAFVFPFLALAFAAEEATERIQVGPFADILILFGSLFILAAALGMLRFPDFYTRLHASTKLVTLGSIGILGGTAITFVHVAFPRVVLIGAFFFLTAPLSGYMIARSGYLRGLRPYREDTSVDEWEACGLGESGPEPAAEAPGAGTG